MTSCAEGIIQLALDGDRSTANLLSMIDAEWISVERERAVIGTIIDLSLSGRPVTQSTISMRLAGVTGKKLARELFGTKEGIAKYLDDLNGRPRPDVGMVALAEQIKLEHTIDTIKRSANEVIGQLDTFTSAEQASTRSIEIMAGAIDSAVGDDGAVDATQLVHQWAVTRADRSKQWSVDWIFPTWEKYCQLTEKQIAVLAAPTGVGKSWFAAGMMERACKAGGRVALFTGEMSGEEILERIIKSAGIDDEQLTSEMPDERVMRRLEEIGDWDFVIHEGRITMDRIRAACVRARAIGKPYKLVIVDHVHLMSFSTGQYRLELNDAMASFKGDIAQRERCAVILLCQLRRPPDATARQRPRKEDIKESSAIEQIADYVFLMAPSSEDDVESNRAMIWCDKRRKGKRFPVIEVDIDGRLNRMIETTGYPVM